MSGAVLSATEMDRTDAELVVAAAAGDHDAFAALYDRYGSRIYDLCAHMLRDRDEAADATAEVFLSASEHLGQLRDPSKCKSWLYAIARNEVYRRTRRRGRETVVDMSGDGFAPAIAAPADDEALGDPAATGALLREAALGLDDRDRFVLELTLAGKLDGRELGDALGVSEDTAYQAAHRMRERLARSVGALLVARQGKADCDQLTALLATWDGTFSVLWRKRVARHVDGCETCERRRKAVPAAIFSGSAFAATPIAFLTPPDWLRERVITGARLEPGSTRGWDRNGFPNSPRRRRRIAMIAVLAAALLLLTVVIANVAGGTANDHRIVKVSSPTTTAAGTRATTTLPPATTTTNASTSPTSLGSGIVATLPTTPGATTPTTPTTRPQSATTVTTAAPDRTGPTIDLSDVPTDLTEGTCPAGSNPPLVVHASDPSGVQSVSMAFSGPHTGTVTLSHLLGTTWRATWNPPPDGVEQSYAVTFAARDERGNATNAGMTINSHICIL